MRKNRMMRTASGLMIAALITTCAISGTFAKYTTEDSAGDTARIAKWGVELAMGGSLYGKAYDTNNVIVADGTDGATVQSVSRPTESVVAPGTQSDGGLHIAVSGTPEVSTKVTAEIKTKNIYLTAGIYGVMVQSQGVTAENFGSGTYYTENSGTYEKAADYAAGSTYYTLENSAVLANTYYPVVYSGAGITGNNATNEDVLNMIAGDIAEDLQGSKVTGTIGEDGITTYEASAIFSPGTDLRNTRELQRLTDKSAMNAISWKWNYSANADLDSADTILGTLMESLTDSGVVKKDGSTYKNVTVDANKLAKVGDDTVACLETSFAIKLNITQED